MSGKGLPLGTVLGIPIRLDWSVVAIFALVTWSLSAAIYPELAPGYRTEEYWIAGAATAALFFASLLAHELSHSLVARRLDINVRDITLWLFGGVSTIEGEAQTPRDELKIALAGPAMSLAIAICGVAIALVLAIANAPDLLTRCFLWLGTINLVLAVFNLVPAAPLDGGRVLHAWLWHRRGNRTSAGITAAHAGRTFGWLLIAIGVTEFLAVDAIGGLWLALLGWFLVMAARAEESQVHLVHDLAGLRVRDVMTARPVTVFADDSVESVLNEYMFRHHCSAFPVVARDGSLLGLLTLARIRTFPAADRATTHAVQLASPLAEVTTAAPDEPLLDAMRRLHDVAGNRMLVMSAGELVGIVSPTDIARAVQVAEMSPAA
jgi:Zn-dependent protease